MTVPMTIDNLLQAKQVSSMFSYTREEKNHDDLLQANPCFRCSSGSFSAQRLGSRNARTGHLLTKELKDFRADPLTDFVNKHQSHMMEYLDEWNNKF